MDPSLALPVACGALAWATQHVVVSRLPEPAADDWTPGWSKPPYERVGHGTGRWLALVAGTGAGTVALSAGPATVPLALVLGGPVAALAVVDAMTTYLPLRLVRGCQSLAALACLVSLSLSADPGLLVRWWTVAVLATSALFWLVWRVTGQLAYGDVRLAPLLALLPASLGLSCWLQYLFLGTLTAALWGLATMWWRRTHPSPLGSIFPYGPGLWIGCWLAVAAA